MRLRFENAIDDFVAFAIYHNEHTPSIRRARGCFKWVLAIGFLAFTAGFAYRMGSELEERGWGKTGWFVALGLASPLLIVIIFGHLRLPSRFRRQDERQTRQMFADGANKAALGPRELELIGDELISRSTYIESRIRLEVIVRVVTDGAYTFIYISPTTAFVIPQDAVLEGDPEAFAEAVRQRIPPAASEMGF